MCGCNGMHIIVLNFLNWSDTNHNNSIEVVLVSMAMWDMDMFSRCRDMAL